MCKNNFVAPTNSLHKTKVSQRISKNLVAFFLPWANAYGPYMWSILSAYFNKMHIIYTRYHLRIWCPISNNISGHAQFFCFSFFISIYIFFRFVSLFPSCFDSRSMMEQCERKSEWGGLTVKIEERKKKYIENNNSVWND